MFSRITGDPTSDLCVHLQRMGIDAEVLPSGSTEELGGFRTFRSLGTSAGIIQVKGRNIDVVQVLMRGMMGPLGGAGEFDAHFVVRGTVEGREPQLTAKAKETKKGFVKKTLVSVTWEGGRLADLLNADGELNNLLIKAGNSPGIVLDPKNQCVRMTTSLPAVTRGVSIGPMPTIGKKTFTFPSNEFVTACDRIAQHLRTLL